MGRPPSALIVSLVLLAEEAAAAGLAPVVAVDAPVHGCEAGWIKLVRTSRSVESAQGLKQSEFLEVAVTPDVQGGLLVRTAQCRLKITQVLSTEIFERLSARLAEGVTTVVRPRAS
jgi:hypothetical protein